MIQLMLPGFENVYPTLVVIDMQEFFEAANDQPTIQAINKEIRKSKENNGAIVLVHYEGNGDFRQEILDEIGTYKKVSQITKRDDGGHNEVNFVVQINNYNPKLRLCGVNTSACVLRTAEGLIKLNYDFTILHYACNQPTHWIWMSIINPEIGYGIVTPKYWQKKAA
jgi:nicotinamidase-related amidase